MENENNKRVAIVTGASSGIGRACVGKFAAEGWNVLAVGRKEHELNLLRDELRDCPGSVRIHLADLISDGHVERLVSDAASHLGRIDALVNSAGIIKNGSIETTTLDDWDRLMNINLRASFHLMQKCIPYLAKTKGSVVNVSSVTGSRAFPGVLAYCVSKAATDQLTRCSALELAPQGIRVNAVNPGVVETNLHKRGGMKPDDYEKFLANCANTHPLGRPGQPAEVAELIYYLASEKASWITGVTYEIDGGRAQTCAR